MKPWTPQNPVRKNNFKKKQKEMKTKEIRNICDFKKRTVWDYVNEERKKKKKT